jgi:hypothetical protein
MQNDGQYFALIPQSNTTIKRIYPKQIWLSHYSGIEMFAYKASLQRWDVVEQSTGLPIASSQASKTDALARSKKVIDSKGTENILAEIETARKAIETMNIYEEHMG